MWTKDYYQELMLGYLGSVQTEIGALEHSRIRRGDLIELYEHFDLSQEHLWRIIRASDTDWERFRFTLEASCGDLLQAFYRVAPSAREPAFAEVRTGQRKYLFKEWDEPLRAKG